MEFLCNDCPRKCNVIRTEASGTGVCRCGYLPYIVRAAPHFWEEPCISGTAGSGAVFFSGCNMHCIYCQNHEISRYPTGKQIDRRAFQKILINLQELGVHNINLVTASHHIRFVADALEDLDLSVPVVWNSSGYESAEMLRMLDGLVSIYLPDYKYRSESTAGKYSSAPDYPTIAEKAIEEMYRQVGPVQIDQDGILKKGVLLRHLILPGEIINSKQVIDWVAQSFKDREILFSLMSQYTPIDDAVSVKYRNLRRPLSQHEYSMLYNYMKDSGIQNGYFQDLQSSSSEMIPDFDETGIP